MTGAVGTVGTTGTSGGVTVTGLHKSFGTQAVLRGIDLEVPAGSFVAVLGPSGSGKTTLLRTIAGFERPDEGTITIGGTVVDGVGIAVPVEQRHIGYVAQEGSLFPHLSVRDNVAFGLPRRLRRRSEVDRLIEAVGLADLASRYPDQLSGGQQQRVAVARALAIEPSLVLLDEPFASLDAQLRSSVRAEVCEILRRSATTAILVTHDQDEALATADLVAVLRRGLIAQIGTPRQLYQRPVDTELAMFLGEANLVEGISDGRTADTPFGRLPLHRPTAPVVTTPASTLVTAQVVTTPASTLVTAPVTVLLRPEQLILSTGGGTGIRARVVRTEYHGHDATVYLAPEPAIGRSAPGAGSVGQLVASDPGRPGELVARVTGGQLIEPGADVLVSAEGPVQAWPA